MRDDWPSHTDPITTRAAVRELARLLGDALSELEARDESIGFGPSPSDEASALASRLNFPEPGTTVPPVHVDPGALPSMEDAWARFARFYRDGYGD